MEITSSSRTSNMRNNSAILNPKTSGTTGNPEIEDPEKLKIAPISCIVVSKSGEKKKLRAQP